MIKIIPQRRNIYNKQLQIILLTSQFAPSAKAITYTISKFNFVKLFYSELDLTYATFFPAGWLYALDLEH